MKLFLKPMRLQGFPQLVLVDEFGEVLPNLAKLKIVTRPGQATRIVCEFILDEQEIITGEFEEDDVEEEDEDMEGVTVQ